MMAYDAHDGYLLLFGGGPNCSGPCNDTWAWRAGSWYRILTARSPPAREWGAMAYDPFDGYVLLFGGLSMESGEALSDTWAYDNGTWTPLPTSPLPAARWGAGLTQDLEDGTMVLFGGYSPATGFLADTWTFVGGRWTSLTETVAPAARWTPGMTFDPEMGAVLLFGGFSASLGFLSDTWLFTGGSWVRLSTPVAPPAREKASLIYDGAEEAVVLFGGDICPVGCGPTRPLRLLNDTWTFQDGSWRNVTETRSPPPQCCGALGYDDSEGMGLLLSANVTAANGTTWSLTFSPPPTTGPALLGFQVFPADPTTVSETSFLVEGRPSNGTLTYRWSGLPPGCVGGDFPGLSCEVHEAGNYTVQLELSDSTGATVNGSLTFRVVLEVPPSLLLPPPPPAQPSPLAVLLTASVVAVTLGIAFHYARRWRGSGGRPSPKWDAARVRKEPTGPVGSSPSPSGEKVDSGERSGPGEA